MALSRAPRAPRAALGREPTAASVRQQAESIGLGWAVLDDRPSAASWATVAVHLDAYQERFEGRHEDTELGGELCIRAFGGGYPNYAWAIASRAGRACYDLERFWSVEPVDTAQAEYWIGRVYDELGLAKPGFIWMPSPRACQRYLARSAITEDYDHYLSTRRHQHLYRTVAAIHDLRHRVMAALDHALVHGLMTRRHLPTSFERRIGADVAQAVRRAVAPECFDDEGELDDSAFARGRRRLFLPMAGRHDLDWLDDVLCHADDLFEPTYRLLVLTAIASYHASWWFPDEREVLCSEAPSRWDTSRWETSRRGADGVRRRRRRADEGTKLHWLDEAYTIAEPYELLGGDDLPDGR